MIEARGTLDILIGHILDDDDQPNRKMHGDSFDTAISDA